MEGNPPRCLALGEAMLRLRVSSGQRLQEVQHLEASVGGAELNAMIAATVVGVHARLLTKLPAGPLGDRVIRHAQQHGVAVTGPRESGGRLGTYYVESGDAPRGTEVIYDRADSSFAHLEPEEFDPDELLADVDHVHVTGISFALGDGPAHAAEKLLVAARDRGVSVSYDINYRSKLWSHESARDSLHRMLDHVTMLFVSPHDLMSFFGAAGQAVDAAREVRDRFLLDRIIISEREDCGPGRTRCRVTVVGGEVGHSDWVEAQVLDPIGAGDALAGVALGEILSGSSDEVAAVHAAAAAALQQTLIGDALVATHDDLSLPGTVRQVRR